MTHSELILVITLIAFSSSVVGGLYLFKKINQFTPSPENLLIRSGDIELVEVNEPTQPLRAYLPRDLESINSTYSNLDPINSTYSNLDPINSSISSNLEPINSSISSNLEPINSSISSNLEPIYSSISSNLEPIYSYQPDRFIIPSYLEDFYNLDFIIIIIFFMIFLTILIIIINWLKSSN